MATDRLSVEGFQAAHINTAPENRHALLPSLQEMVKKRDLLRSMNAQGLKPLVLEGNEWVRPGRAEAVDTQYKLWQIARTADIRREAAAVGIHKKRDNTRITEIHPVIVEASEKRGLNSYENALGTVLNIWDNRYVIAVREVFSSVYPFASLKSHRSEKAPASPKI